MSSWGPWSRCSARCGRGQSERRRRIEIYASNGGAGCGERRQTRGCYHNDRRCRNYEIAQLLPAHFNRKRDEPDKYERESEADKVAARKNSYCIHYRITALAWYCRYASPYHVLSVGSKVCAKCHDTAMDRNGKCKGSYTGVTSRWKALMGRPCNGRWKSEGGVVDNCDCGEVQGRDFIFV